MFHNTSVLKQVGWHAAMKSRPWSLYIWPFLARSWNRKQMEPFQVSYWMGFHIRSSVETCKKLLLFKILGEFSSCKAKNVETPESRPADGTLLRIIFFWPFCRGAQVVSKDRTRPLHEPRW